MEINEQDWKLFRKRIGGWQEAYMDRLNREYLAPLSGEGAASEKFWRLEKRPQKDKQSPGVVIDMRRSMLFMNMLQLLGDGVIGPEDLEGFSEELRARLARCFTEN